MPRYELIWSERTTYSMVIDAANENDVFALLDPDDLEYVRDNSAFVGADDLQCVSIERTARQPERNGD